MDENDTRKFRKPLDQNHWMVRLQKYTFGIDAPTFYMGYCPFFWMTWLAVLVTPVVFLGKNIIAPLFNLFMNACTYAADAIDGVLEPKREAVKLRKKEAYEQLRQTPLKPTPAFFVRLKEFADKTEGEFDLQANVRTVGWILDYSDYDSSRLKVWFEQNPSWETTDYPAAKEFFDAAAKKVQDDIDAALAEQNRKIAKKKAREQALSKISCSVGSIAQKVLRPVLIIAALVATFYLVTGAVWLAFNAPWLQIGFGLVLFVAVVAVVFGVRKFLKWVADDTLFFEKTGDVIESAYNKAPVFSWIAAPFVYVFLGIAWVFKSVIRFFKAAGSFLFQTVTMTYKAECPMIEWGDKTEPIQRREKTVA